MSEARLTAEPAPPDLEDRIAELEADRLVVRESYQRCIAELVVERDKFAALAETLPRATARIAELETERDTFKTDNIWTYNRIAELEAEVARLTAEAADEKWIMLREDERRAAVLAERDACETDVFAALHNAPWDLPQPTDEQRAFANGLHAAIAAIRARPMS
jgi:chromosome segregation ATPase